MSGLGNTGRTSSITATDDTGTATGSCYPEASRYKVVAGSTEINKTRIADDVTNVGW